MSRRADVVRLMPPGGGGWRPTWHDPLRQMKPQEAVERSGLSYYRVLEIFRVHGRKFGGRYYMTEREFLAALEMGDEAK